ncbi:DUF1549 domain-containing protein [Prosthecobacter sp. SYSU 5D2]|uniref:DUF1549 domain-containing protein n=1 Tax=Prosthecobacter sp. SYSU 5D2 TaxID=3134134 RepID=UPI0031FF421B
MKTFALLFLAASLSHGAALPEAAKIDSLLADGWQKQNLQPNPAAPDEVIVRRLYLDIAGRIPTVEETREFLASPAPDKRARLIDKLLASDGYTSHLFNFWADVLRLTDNTKGRITAEAYEEWLKKELKANTPYDQFVKKLLTTDGGAWDSGSIGFYQRDENKLDHLAYTVQVFLGTSIVCAQCHNHPFDKWSQKDYYGMAAFTYGMDIRGGDVTNIKLSKRPMTKPQLPEQLANLSGKERRQYMKDHPEEVARLRKEAAAAGKVSNEEMNQVRKALGDVMRPLRYTAINWQEGKLPKLPADYAYDDAKPGQTIEARAMFGHEAKPKEGQTTVQAFADWMASPENPRFTTVIANRMWKHVFGLGLIEPLDEMTDSTVASNPALMDYLTQLMIEKKYSIKSFLRVLYNTDTYQRMASTQEVALGETYHFTGPTLRRMSAEQVWDSLITLSQGNVDSAVDEENQRLHQYLDDLNLFIGTMKDKGPEGIIAAAKEGIARRQENDRQLTLMREKMAAEKGGNADPASAKALANAANKLRREASNDLLTNLIGEERAEALIRGYRPNQQIKKTARPVMKRSEMRNMTKEQRKEMARSSVDRTMVARASELPSPAKPGHFLRTFGQSDREVIDNASEAASVPQALTLLNGPVVQSLSNPGSQLSQQLAQAGSPDQKASLLYEALLSRRPTQDERIVLTGVIQERGDNALEDITHALLTGSQFLFIQ